MVIDPYRARTDRCRDPLRPVNIARPNRRRQAAYRVVCYVYGFIFIVERKNDHDRTKDLMLSFATHP